MYIEFVILNKDSLPIYLKNKAFVKVTKSKKKSNLSKSVLHDELIYFSQLLSCYGIPHNDKKYKKSLNSFGMCFK